MIRSLGGWQAVKDARFSGQDRIKSDHRILGDSAFVEEVMAAGAQGFVLKRTAATDLIPAVRAVLRGRKYVSPQLKKEGKHTR